ncbi:MAG: cadherin-like beta sandwich domain-containing protein [Spirochaetaceae bacterium]|jgi:hypothetical protein|nr:cadherin-like beta sandwich domain-containing protein [Spirochaetaceae bacterium]
MYKYLYFTGAFIFALVLGCSAQGAGAGDYTAENKNEYAVNLVVEKAEFADKVHLDIKKAKAGKQISFTVEPVEMYLPPIIEIVDGGAKAVGFKTEKDTTTFKMPSGGVTISVRFSDDPEFDATLSSLSASQKALSPAFDPATTAYSVELPAGSTLLTLSFSASGHSAVLTAASPKDIALSEGKNQTEIIVTSPNGKVQKSYVIEAAVLPTLIVNSVTVTPSGVDGISFTQAPDNLEFAYLPYLSTGSKARVSVDATSGTVMQDGDGEFDLNVGKETSRDIVLSRTVDGITRSESFTVVMKVFEGNTPAWKVSGAEESRKIYSGGAWHDVYIFNTAGTRKAGVSGAFTGELLVVGGGRGGNGAHNVGSWQSGGGGSGGEVVLKSAYSFAAGDYDVVVGAGGSGGAAVASGGNRANTGGGAGGASSFDAVKASGGAAYSQDWYIQRDGYDGQGAGALDTTGASLFYGEKGLKGRANNADKGQSTAAGRGGNGGTNNGGSMRGGSKGYNGIVIIRD